jgi:hypothetical protein
MLNERSIGHTRIDNPKDAFSVKYHILNINKARRNVLARSTILQFLRWPRCLTGKIGLLSPNPFLHFHVAGICEAMSLLFYSEYRLQIPLLDIAIGRKTKTRRRKHTLIHNLKVRSPNIKIAGTTADGRAIST